LRRSFFKKLFIGSISILVLTFVLQWAFQQLWIEQAVLSRAQQQIESQLVELPEAPSALELQQVMNQLTSLTGTFNTIINPDEVQQQTLQLATITINDNGTLYTLLRPRTAMGTIRMGMNVQGSFYASKIADVYVPIELTIGTRRLFGNQLTMSFSSELFQQLGVDTSTTYNLTGTIVRMNEIIVEDTQQVLYNSELLNLMSQTNITDLTQTERWVRYQSLDEERNPVNLVYVTPLVLQQNNLLLLTIYPLASTTIITQTLFTISIGSLLSALFITTLLYGWFFQRVSVPLRQVNEATRRFSLLDFSPIPVIPSNDEIEDLSNNINILSATLSTTLHELEDRNHLLLEQLEQERINERQREDLVAGISHELKTPLAILQASLEAIKLGMVSDDELPEFQQTMDQEIQRANQIILNLLHLQHVDSSDVTQHQAMDLKPIVQSSLDQYLPLIKQRGCELDVVLEPCHIQASQQKMELVVSNLLSNAIKYSGSSGTITVHLSATRFEVSNPTTLPNNTNTADLFLPFHRADKSRSRQDGSTGLGLSIVKQLLDQHHIPFDCTITNSIFRFRIDFNS
jgi:signal transduction histidine kinase